MHRNRSSLKNLSRMSAAIVAAAAVAMMAFTTGCGEDPEDNQDNNQAHEDASGVEIETRGNASEVIAAWNPDDGWTDGDGEDIDELPTPIDDESEGLIPMTEDGANASLTVRFLGRDGEEIDMDTLERDEDVRDRQCTEYSARYWPTDDHDDTDVIAWNEGGAIPHPDSNFDNPPHQFVETSDDELVGIFHCDHVHFYPENAGTVDVEFLLWHGDHQDDITDPITVRVEEGGD